MAVDREEFARRLRLQVQARYRGNQVEVDSARFSLHVTAPGLDVQLPLAPLHHAFLRDPATGAEQIARYVQSIERRLSPVGEETEPEMPRLLWCVRSRDYMADIGRRDDLLTRPLGGELVAFVAESLPGVVMQGVPRSEWRRHDVTDEAASALADENTAVRFTSLLGRIDSAERVPGDGWRLGGDQLFQGSVLLLAEIRAALVRRAGCDVLLANPDRAVVIAVPAGLPAAERFRMRAVREWREALHPCSRDVFTTDGASLELLGRRATGRRVLLPWLSE